MQSGIGTIAAIGPAGVAEQAALGNGSGLGYGFGNGYGTGDILGPVWNGNAGANALYGGSNAYGNGYNSGTSNGNTQGSLLGMLGSLLQQLGSYLSQLTGSGAGGGFGTGAGYAGGYGSSSGPSQYAQNVTLSSTGDPHLAETGTIASGGTSSTVNAHFDSMTSHADLVSTNDVRGGYQVSTSVTAPNASGVTYNQSATVTTANGNDTVTMTNGGNVSITQFGQTTTLADGQSMQLTNGATVARAADGSVTISESNRNGGSISTTLRQNGPGVDVTTNAQGVRIAGDIVNGGTTAAPEPPRETPTPIRYGVFEPGLDEPFGSALTRQPSDLI
jgi:hypothetical protein